MCVGYLLRVKIRANGCHTFSCIHPACGIPWFNYLLRVKVPEKSARKFLGGRHQSPPLIIYRHVDYLVITCTHDANVFSSLFLNYHDLALSSLPKRNRDEDNCPWEMYPREAEIEGRGTRAKGKEGGSGFCRFSKKKTDVSIGGAERPRWSTMASNRIYIPGEPVFTPANHPGFRPRYEGD